MIFSPPPAGSEEPDRASGASGEREKRSAALKSALLNIFVTESIAGHHVDEAAEILSHLPPDGTAAVLRQVRLIAHSVSDLLAFGFIEHAGKALEILSLDQLEDWVRGALAVYESEGLHQGLKFLADAHTTARRYTERAQVATLRDTESRLKFLAAGLTGKILRFKQSDRIYTDTRTIFSPRSLSILSSAEDNELLYRVLAVHKCAQIRYHSFLLPLAGLKKLFPEQTGHGLFEDAGRTTGLELFCRLLPHPDSAGSLLAVVDTVRIESALSRDFPGLGKDLSRLKALLRAAGTPLPRLGPFSDLTNWILKDYHPEKPATDPELARELMKLRQPGASSLQAAAVATRIAEAGPDPEALVSLCKALPYVGTISPAAVGRQLVNQRQRTRQRFLKMAAALVLEHRQTGAGEKKAMPGASGVSCTLPEGERAVALISIPAGAPGEREQPSEPPKECLMLDGTEIEISPELRDIIREIRDDLGEFPTSYLSAACGLASGTYSPVDTGPMPEALSPATGHTYDEWDFRREAYRRNWCTLKEKQVPEASGDFVAQTLDRYRGQLITLRRQFEMLRHAYRFKRRQQEGDDVDLDAAVDAYADFHASAGPSEHLFIRQLRDKRDIAVAFLVDMSASTEGWVNRAIRESLILLCEAFNALRDRYAIYGFSGMRRTGCQFFHIKDFDQTYDASVRRRITGIKAQDYTRMGPPIRHATKLLEAVEARLKILIILSDGKPEDYDEYKGHYAIEDTRKALVEARERGIRPFCITIEREAREYLPHMYGESNYIFIPDVSRLHRKIPEMYRLLTT